MSRSPTQLPLFRALSLTLLAFLFGLFLLLTVPAEPVAASCGGTTSVSNETELNAAIAAFNAGTTTPCVFTIALTQNIDLTASTTQINNTTSGIELVIDGGGFAVDGKGTSGVQPFNIAASTRVTMNAIIVTGGHPNGNGGGISNRGALTLIDSTVTGNTAADRGGGIDNGGALTVTDSTITGNSAQVGGGISNNVNTPVLITGSTIANNAASLDGGGVFNTGNPMTIRNSTISANKLGQYGGGIYNESHLTLDSVTINLNDGWALYNAQGVVTIQNSILANSTGDYDCVNGTTGTVSITNPNLVETQYNCGTFSLTSDPQLGPLANNGGPTQTHALLAGSPAIDAGDTTLTTDQRGEPRPGGTTDDIGAYEKQRGTIVIEKRTAPAGGTGFSFTDTIAAPNSFTLDDGGSKTFVNVVPGSYIVTEDAPAASLLTGLSCDDGASAVPSTWDLVTRTATIQLERGETVTCTFTNKALMRLYLPLIAR